MRFFWYRVLESFLFFFISQEGAILEVRIGFIVFYQSLEGVERFRVSRGVVGIVVSIRLFIVSFLNNFYVLRTRDGDIERDQVFVFMGLYFGLGVCGRQISNEEIRQGIGRFYFLEELWRKLNSNRLQGDKQIGGLFGFL